MTECKPPEGTPDGAVLDLFRHHAAAPCDLMTTPERSLAIWGKENVWHMWSGGTLTSNQATSYGWRIATPPAAGKEGEG